MNPVVGVIGAGEAGLAVGGGLAAAGVRVVTYDVAFEDATSGQDRRSAAVAAGLEPSSGPAEVARLSHVVLCLATARAAEQVVRSLAPHLTPRHLVADANSASPELMSRVAEVVENTGARFADVAVMAAVTPHRHQVPLLASGSGAAEFTTWGTELGMRIECVDGPAGAASCVKMMRSLLVKGIEALILQTGRAAARYGVLDRVLDSMGDLPFDDWRVLADYLLHRTALHGERRGHELLEVAATLRGLSVDPGLAEAGAMALLDAARNVATCEVAAVDGAADRHAILEAFERYR